MELLFEGLLVGFEVVELSEVLAKELIGVEDPALLQELVKVEDQV